MTIVLFDTSTRARLFPLTLTRAVAGLHCGILSVYDWWEQCSHLPVAVYTAPYLQELYNPLPVGDLLLIDASVLPTTAFLQRVLLLGEGEAILDSEGLVAGRIKLQVMPVFGTSLPGLFTQTQGTFAVERFTSPCDLFKRNNQVLRDHFQLITKRRFSQHIPETVQVINPLQVFIEEGARLHFCILNAADGPIYIGKDAEIMEGSTIRGPFAMCEGAALKMGSKIYGGTTLGPYAVAGGEVKNSILMGYSNKAHDGYLGDSVIGEWCNLGAGTNNSNVKNTATEVKVWDYFTHRYINSGIKCGLIMGDYSRTAINTAVNTGTVIGVCCNVFGEGLTPKVIPDFTWGTKGLTRYEFDKAVRDIVNWKRMKNKDLGETKLKVLKHIFEHYNEKYEEV